MFWECHIVSSAIDKLLDQPLDTVKLQDFLDENDLIQECLTQNKRLIDYLVQKEVMNELIEQIIQRPADDNFRNAHVVSELLSGDFQRIQETLLEKEHLDLLYSFLQSNSNDKQAIQNPILAAYFARIWMTLIIRKPNEVLDYFKSRETFQKDFFNHLDSTSIADVLYRFISDFGDERSEAIQWYEDINLIDGLIEQLLLTDSVYVQMNIINLLSEFLRLAFDQHNGLDIDLQGNPLTLSNLDPFAYNGNGNDEGSSSSNPFLTNDDPDNKPKAENKSTPLVLAQHILSKSNLEQLFDVLSKQPRLVANGCELIITVLDLFDRYMPAPVCIPLISSSAEESPSANKDNNEGMQVDDEGDTLPVTKSNETSSNEMNRNVLKTLSTNAKDSLVRIYLIFLEIIPSRLPSLIALLSIPSAPLRSSSSSSSPSHDNSQTVKYQFISEPLGMMRLNLIKLFSKLIYTISNDHTGDSIYQILDSNRFLHVLINLFQHHIYNNFLHTQVSLIIRLILHINSLAVKQPNDIWTRVPFPNQLETSESVLSNSSSLHYTNRCSYKLFQNLLTSSEVNLIERLLDQYELNMPCNKSLVTSSSSDDAISTSFLHTRFASPNSGHVAQILRNLREHASTFNNYSSFFQTNDQQQMDDNTNALEIRWQTALDYLNEDEKKWSAMNPNERNSTSTFTLSSAVNFMAQISHAINSNNSSEAGQQRQTFHMRSFGSSAAPYIDDDDDEVERFNIDDELMNNEQTDNEQKVAEMENTSFEHQFPPVFDDQAFWHQEDDANAKKSPDDYNNMKKPSASLLPDLFENDQMQQEKSELSTESNFEQLCSLRANDHGSGPFQSPASSTIHDGVAEEQDEF